jgi:hypothetical protein
MYAARETVMEECVVTSDRQHRSLKLHMASQHPEVLDFVPPSLYSPSPATRTTTFRRPLDATTDWCELVRKTGRTARAFSIPTLRPNALFQWRLDRTKVRTLLEVRQTRAWRSTSGRSFAASAIRDGKPRPWSLRPHSQLPRSMSAKRH